MSNVLHLRPQLEPFDEFWSIYPKKWCIGRARQQWPWALAKTHNDTAIIIEGARRYAAHVQREGTDIRYVANPGQWLADERWHDEYSLPQVQTQPVDIRQSMEAKAAQGNRFAQDWMKRNT